jgi:hypothetical protein
MVAQIMLPTAAFVTSPPFKQRPEHTHEVIFCQEDDLIKEERTNIVKIRNESSSFQNITWVDPYYCTTTPAQPLVVLLIQH